MDEKMQPKPLTGEKLVQKINQLGNYSKEEKAKVCGYYSVTKDNQTRVNLPKFYDAILEAKGVTLEPMSFKDSANQRIPRSGTVHVYGVYGRQERTSGWKIFHAKVDKYDRQEAYDRDTYTDNDNESPNILEKGNRIIAFASGGAFLGGLIAQVPGAIAGAIIAAIYGTFVKTATDQPE
jgi:hypothetical protein